MTTRKNNGLATDTPIATICEDNYGQGTIANTLSSILTSAHTKPPLSIALDGKWGSGKSSVVNMTDSILKQNGIKTLMFNLWYHQEEKHLLASLMKSFLNEIPPPFISIENLFFRSRLFVERVIKVPHKLIFFILFIIATVFIVGVVQKFYDVGTYVAIGLTILFFFSNTKSFTSKIKWFLNTPKGIFGFKNFNSDIGLREEFKNELELLVKATGTKVVLFLDDLDRCKDKDIIKIMQTVNYLASIKDLYIVMAVDLEKVLSALQREYRVTHEKDIQVPTKYIEKIFNVIISLPSKEGNFIKEFEISELEKFVVKKQNSVFQVFQFISKFFWVFVVISSLVYFSKDLTNTLKPFQDKAVTFINKTLEKEEAPQKKEEVQKKEKTNVVENNDTVETPQEQLKRQRELPQESRDLNDNFILEPQIEISYTEYLLTPIFIFFVLTIPTFFMWRFTRKAEREDAKEEQLIKKRISQITDITPREEKILFNKVKFINNIGKRRIIDNDTFKPFLLSAWNFCYSYILFFLLEKTIKIDKTKRANIQKILSGMDIHEETDEKEIDLIVKYLMNNKTPIKDKKLLAKFEVIK